MKLAHREREVFAVLFLDHHHRAIEFAEMCRGTITGTANQAWLGPLNCAAVILIHNRPR